MKIVNRRMMLQEPISTVYCAWLPNSYVELRVMTGLCTDGEEWISIRLVDNVKTSLFLDQKFVKSIPQFHPMPGESRSELWLVWEAADINTMLARMTAASASLAIAAQQHFGD